jgi:hypothetical protein
MSDQRDDYGRFVQPRAEEELHQSPPAAVAMGTSPDDGLPMPVALPNIDSAPPLTEDTLVCMADKRSFVVRDYEGCVLATFTPAVVTRLPNGLYATAIVAASDKEPWPKWWGRRNAEAHLHLRNERIVVDPIRPECEHYLRMQTDLAADRDHRYIARACRAQRAEDGEYYSVRDTLVSACNMRSPRHYESEALLDKFDEALISRERAREDQESFDVDAELAAELAKSDLGVLG